LIVQGQREQRQEHFLVLNHGGHRRSSRNRGVARDHQVDLVDVEQLGIDGGHSRGTALVIVIDKLHFSAEQAAFGIHLFGPNLIGQERRLAAAGEAAAQRHAKSDFDRRLARLSHHRKS
jgi:hypothetical protein